MGGDCSCAESLDVSSLGHAATAVGPGRGRPSEREEADEGEEVGEGRVCEKERWSAMVDGEVEEEEPRG